MFGSSAEVTGSDSAESLRERIENRFTEGLICALGSAVTAGEVYLSWNENGELNLRLAAVSLGCAALSGKLFQNWHDLRNP